jgi:hypothetical protein
MRTLRPAIVSALFLVACDPEGCLDDTVVDVPGAVTGNACDPDTDEALPNVTVTATPSDLSSTLEPKTASTGTTGGFTINELQPRVAYDITFLEDGNPVLIAGQVQVASNQTLPLPGNPACRPPPDPTTTGSVEGSICDRHVGSLLAGAAVIADVNGSKREGTVGEGGRFRVDGITAGEGTVTIKSDGGYERTFPITIEAGEVFTIEIGENCDLPSTSTGCFNVYACDIAAGANVALAGATVTATSVDGEVRIDRTDTKGFSEICALTPGSWFVDVTPAGAVSPILSEEVVIIAGEDDLSLRGNEECSDRVEVGRISGSVCNEGPDGGVFVGTVELRREDGTRVGEPVQTEVDGDFAFEDVPPGEYVLAFPNDPDVPAIPVTVTGFQTTGLVARNCPLPAQECTPFTSAPEETADGRIYFVVDKSGSMNEVAAGFGGSKWDALRGAVSTVTSTLTSGSIDYALAAFPNPRNTACELDTPTDFACTVACAAGIEVGAMGQTSANQVNQSLTNIDPFGGTPTASTLAGLRTTIENLAAIDRPLAVVLATDGAPNCAVTTGLDPDDLQRTNCAVQFGAGSVCTSSSGNCVQSGGVCNSNAECGGGGDTCDLQTTASCAPFNCLDLSAINRVQDIARLGVDVHVVGINAASANPATDPFVQTLNAMAVAGGAPLTGTTRFHAATDTDALQGSLQAITRQILACSVTVPFDLGDGTGISLKVGETPILRNTSRTNGWDIVGPNQIQLFGAACDRATATVASTTVTQCVVAQ